MTFRNPLTSLPADSITSGTFTGTYRNAGTFTLAGDPAGSHVQASSTALIFYAADGVTPLISMDTAGGAGAITSSTITGGTLRTAPSGRRLELSSATVDTLSGYTGLTGEQGPGLVQISAASAARGPGGRVPANGGLVQLLAPNLGGSGSLPAVLVMSQDPANPATSSNAIGLVGDYVQLKRGGAANPSDLYARDDLLAESVSGSAATVGSWSGALQVNFPAGMFSSPPVVLITPTAGFSQCVVQNLTASGFVLRTWGATGAVTTNGTAISFGLLAVKP